MAPPTHEGEEDPHGRPPFESALPAGAPRCQPRTMSSSSVEPILSRFLAAADAAAAARPEVDRELAREVLREAAVMLHDGLALDGLDEHDAEAVVDGLGTALVSADPGAAIRECSRAVLAEPGDLHDPETAAGAYLVAASVLRV